MEPSREQFLFEEAKLLKSEIHDHMATVRLVETYSAGAVAALLSWFTLRGLPGASYAWYLPAVIPILGAARSYASHVHVRQIGKYLAQTEKVFLGNVEPKGWENTRKAAGFAAWSALFWVLLLLTALLVPKALHSVAEKPTIKTDRSLEAGTTARHSPASPTRTI